MSKIINITDKLSTEKPSIQIGEKIYPINDGMGTVLKFEELLKDSTVTNLVASVALTLGDDAAAEIGVSNMSLNNFRTLTTAILAAMQGISFDEAEARFREFSKSN